VSVCVKIKKRKAYPYTNTALEGVVDHRHAPATLAQERDPVNTVQGAG